MEIRWQITSADIKRIQEFISERQNDVFVQHRRKRNLASSKPRVTESPVWHVMVGCLLTTQQRSGPGTPVSKFMRRRPFPLNYEVCRKHKQPAKLCLRTLESHGGIRRTRTISDQAARNLHTLENGLWPELKSRLNSLCHTTTPATERATAQFLQDNLHGIGPKQARNMVQWLGLSRFEIPLDSRITKWLNKFGFPVELNSTALADQHYYNFVSGGVQQLCEASGEFPCVLDAAIFSSFDGDKWTEEEVALSEGLNGV